MSDPARWRDLDGSAPPGFLDLLKGARRTRPMTHEQWARGAARVARLGAAPVATGAPIPPKRIAVLPRLAFLAASAGFIAYLAMTPLSERPSDTVRPAPPVTSNNFVPTDDDFATVGDNFLPVEDKIGSDLPARVPGFRIVSPAALPTKPMGAAPPKTRHSVGESSPGIKGSPTTAKPRNAKCSALGDALCP